ncbi:MAG TPA: 2-polyprenylphenol 6-hydroxylase [Rickettsiales bacterium]|nr:2-polyprenylphenol 6-hydroxylase [Rickettsiales bacterium]
MLFRTIKNTSRLLVIVLTLVRHNALFIWRGEPSFEKGKRFARALEQLGPTFIKLGQILSTRSDLIGQDVALALTELQDRVPPFPSAQVHQIIEEQLGRKTGELFATFDDAPAAAASIAQVHFATLHDGQEVAVKILRPNIEEAFARDVSLLYWMADLVEYGFPSLLRFKLAEVARTFEDMIRFELDLRFEAAAAVELKNNLKGPTDLYVPNIHWNYTGHRVLTIERIRGIPISDVAALQAAGHDPAKLVDIAAVSFFNQVFRDGYFHADMHPGNMFVLPNGRIAVVDFGIMGRIDQRSRIYLAQILHGFLTEDYYNLAKVHFDAGFVPPHKSVESFALAMMAITKPIIGRKLSEISVARLLGQLFTTAETFEMEAQPHLLLLQKNMMLTEGVGRMLNPEVNMWQVVQPLIEHWAKENLGARARIKEHLNDGVALFRTLPTLVSRAEATLARINAGEGLREHMAAQRRAFHRQWLLLGWIALAAFIALHFMR